jgi:hypothetical protein
VIRDHFTSYHDQRINNRESWTAPAVRFKGKGTGRGALFNRLKF